MTAISESDYLREDLGPVLAKGLAAVAIARPPNPTEYLALWLLHHVQQLTRKAEEVQQLKDLEGEREQWSKGRVVREKQASSVIQREWRAHVRQSDERKQEEAALRDIFASIEEVAEEEVGEEPLTYGTAAEGPDSTNDEEKEIEQERAVAYASYKRGQLFVNALDKSHIANIKPVISSGSGHCIQVLRCCLYAQGAKASRVETLEQIKALVKPFTFSEWMRSFDAVGQPPARGRQMARVNRLISRVDEDEVKECSAALHAIFGWLKSGALYRSLRDAHIKHRREAGKDTGEEELEEVDEEAGQPADDIDAVEEGIKAEEEAERKRAEEEAANAGQDEEQEEEEQ